MSMALSSVLTSEAMPSRPLTALIGAFRDYAFSQIFSQNLKSSNDHIRLSLLSQWRWRLGTVLITQTSPDLEWNSEPEAPDLCLG